MDRAIRGPAAAAPSRFRAAESGCRIRTALDEPVRDLLLFDVLRETITRSAHNGAGWADIEERLITSTSLPEDERAAPWLSAWVEHDDSRERA
jgi:hypothetical protein